MNLDKKRVKIKAENVRELHVYENVSFPLKKILKKCFWLGKVW